MTISVNARRPPDTRGYKSYTLTKPLALSALPNGSSALSAEERVNVGATVLSPKLQLTERRNGLVSWSLRGGVPVNFNLAIYHWWHRHRLSGEERLASAEPGRKYLGPGSDATIASTDCAQLLNRTLWLP